MKDEDLTDTAPVIMNEKTCVAFESLDLGINERGEIVLAPDRAMRRPTLFMADKGSEIVVEAIFHGRAAVPRLGQLPISIFRFGRQLGMTVTRDEPIKIVITNNGPEPTSISASLVDTPEADDSVHHPREDLKGRE
jgi:hypothetical protein